LTHSSSFGPIIKFLDEKKPVERGKNEKEAKKNAKKKRKIQVQFQKEENNNIFTSLKCLKSLRRVWICILGCSHWFLI